MTVEEVREWIRIADNDLKGAKHELAYGEEMIPEHIGFFCQQAAEKYLKAFLTAHEISFPKTHHLIFLASLCATIDPEFTDLDFGDLNSFAVETRYPFLRSLLILKPETLKKHFELAESIGILVKHKLGITSGG